MNFANEYVGLPFKSRGRTKEGIDCWGLVRIVYNEQFNIRLPSYDDEYDSSFNVRETEESIERHAKEWIPIIRGQEEIGDVIVLRLSGHPTHVGVVVDKSKMLHIIEGTDAVVENYEGFLWTHRVIGFFRHKEFIEWKKNLIL